LSESEEQENKKSNPLTLQELLRLKEGNGIGGFWERLLGGVTQPAQKEHEVEEAPVQIQQLENSYGDRPKGVGSSMRQNQCKAWETYSYIQKRCIPSRSQTSFAF